MVEPLARGETARVTIGGVRERSARRQRRQAVLGTEGIEIESERRRCEKDAAMPAKATAMKTRFIIT